MTAPRSMTCTRCGSMLSAVTFTCIREDYCGEPSESPKSTALSLLVKLKHAEERGKAMRDIVASVAETPASEEVIRGTLRLLVKAYDKGNAA